MKRREFCLASAFAAAAFASSAPAREAASAGKGNDFMKRTSHAKEEAELMRLEKEFAEAAGRGDAAAFERHLAPGFFAVDASGAELPAEQVLARMRTPGYVVESLRHDNVRVRSLSGDCAIVTAQTTLRAKFQDKDVSGEYPYLRLWQRHGRRWLALVTVGFPAKPKAT